MSTISLGGILELAGAPTPWSLTTALNGGWTGRLGFPRHVNTRFSAPSHFSMSIKDDQGRALIPPLMLAGFRGRKWGKTLSTSMEILDRTSWRLNGGSESFDTFIEGDASDITAAIADRFDVTINGAPTFALYREDIKLSTGWDPLRRIAVCGGKVLVVNTDGSVDYQNSTWVADSANFIPDEVEEGYRPLDRAERLFVTKTTGIGSPTGPQYYDFTTAGNATGELYWPLSAGSSAHYEGGVGTVAWVSLWDGPPDSGGRLLYIDALNGDEVDGYTAPFDGVWPATHYKAIVYPSLTDPDLPIQARLLISGTPYSDLPAGIDGAIAKEFGTGRGLQTTFSDSMIPSLAHATSNWENWLREANRGTDYLTARGPLNCDVRVGQTWGWAGLTGRIEQITWSGGGRVPRTEIIVNLDI